MDWQFEKERKKKTIEIYLKIVNTKKDQSKISFIHLDSQNKKEISLPPL